MSSIACGKRDLSCPVHLQSNREKYGFPAIPFKREPEGILQGGPDFARNFAHISNEPLLAASLPEVFQHRGNLIILESPLVEKGLQALKGPFPV